MKNMTLKIVFRNISKHWKIGLLAILGTFIATMLLVGGLSLNDSVSNYLNNKIVKNFGKIDLVIRDKSDTIFLPKSLKVESIETLLRSQPEVTDFTPVKLAQIRARIGKKYVDMYAIAVTPEFERYIGRKIDRIVVSEDTVQDFDISIGDKIEIITSKDTFYVTIEELGKNELNFRGETGSGNGTIFLPESLFDEYRIYPIKEPNTFFVTLNIPIYEHERFSEKLEKIDGTIRTRAAKHRLATSPLNKIIGYLFIGFSGFSVISSFLFIAAFFGILTEERKNSLGVLRALGFSRRKMFFILFLEGVFYLLLSEIVGALAGIGFGRHLLKIINSFQRKDELFAFVQDTITYKVSVLSIIYAIVIAAIVPIFILTIRSFEFSNASPALLYSGRSFEELPKKKICFKNIAITIFISLILLLLYRVSVQYFLVGLLAIVPLYYRKSLISLVYGSSIIMAILPILSTGAGREFLLRSGFTLIGSIYIVFGFLPYMKGFFEKFKSIPVLLSIAYIERHKNRNFAMFMVYSVTLILILVSAIVPYSISRYIEGRKEEGAFGYDFIIIENPLKTFFGSYKYLEDDSFISKFESLVPVQLVEGKFPNDNNTYVFILTNERVLDKLVLPSEKLMKQLKEIESSKIEDRSLFISNKVEILRNVKTNGEVEITLKGVLPGISPKIRET
ncbi:MAG: ABC transporter permease, partial [Fervidobacterium sp.]